MDAPTIGQALEGGLPAMPRLQGQIVNLSPSKVYGVAVDLPAHLATACRQMLALGQVDRVGRLLALQGVAGVALAGEQADKFAGHLRQHVGAVYRVTPCHALARVI